MSDTAPEALMDDTKKECLEKYLNAEQKVKELEEELKAHKEEKEKAVKELGFDSENDSSFSAYLDKVRGSDVYKGIMEGFKVAGKGIKDAAESDLVKNIGSGVKKMALNLARTLSQAGEEKKAE